MHTHCVLKLTSKDDIGNVLHKLAARDIYPLFVEDKQIVLESAAVVIKARNILREDIALSYVFYGGEDYKMEILQTEFKVGIVENKEYSDEELEELATVNNVELICIKCSETVAFTHLTERKNIDSIKRQGLKS